MKIGILTQPLGENYGGILQAYALQALLKKLGHQVWTEDRLQERDESAGLQHRMYERVKNVSIKDSLDYLRTIKSSQLLIKKALSIITDTASLRVSTNEFVKSNISLTVPNRSRTKEVFAQYGFEAYIVGSDQVWRPSCYPYLYNYFLDFTKDTQVKRIAYAASFGTDEWEFTPEQTSHCASLLKKFDAVSVREKSAVQLCREHFGVDAIHVLDPTLLLNKADYLSLLTTELLKKRKKYCVAYTLGINAENYNILEEVAEHLQCKGKMITLRPWALPKELKRYKNYNHLPVEDWLSQFYQASFVITDSFHGCVFAILFHKPFVVIENKGRGSARFHSLLDLLGLQDRLVTSYDDFLCKKMELLSRPVDYDKVNAVLKIKQTESMDFLKCALSSPV